MRRIVIVGLIAFAGFFVGAYPDESINVVTTSIRGIATGANAAATSIITFFRTLFA